MSLIRILLFCWVSLISSVGMFYFYYGQPIDNHSHTQEKIKSESNQTRITGYDSEGKQKLTLSAQSLNQSPNKTNASKVSASLLANSIYKLDANHIEQESKGHYVLHDAVVTSSQDGPCEFELKSSKIMYDPIKQYLYSDRKIILKYDDIITHMIGGKIDLKKQQVEMGRNIYMQANPEGVCLAKR